MSGHHQSGVPNAAIEGRNVKTKENMSQNRYVSDEFELAFHRVIQSEVSGN